MRILVAAAVAGSLLVAGCTTNPYTGEKQVAKGAYGAAIGAALGCGVAMATTVRVQLNTYRVAAAYAQRWHNRRA